MSSLAGGGGPVGETQEGLEGYLWWVLGLAEVVRSGGSVERGGWRRSALARRRSAGRRAGRLGCRALVEVWEGGGAAGLGNAGLERGGPRRVRARRG